MNRILILWTFFLLSVSSFSQQDFYWIGGDGAWNDTTQWSSTSGGPADKTSLPTKEDNVFFDVNSFDTLGQELNLDTMAVAFCKDMSWSGVQHDPTFNFLFDTLYVHGSLTFDTAMSLKNASTNGYKCFIEFRSDEPGNRIVMAGHTVKQIIFDVDTGSGGGSWELLDSLSTNAKGDIIIKQGSFYSNGFLIRADGFIVSNGHVGDIIIDSSEIFVHDSGYRAFNFSDADSVSALGTTVNLLNEDPRFNGGPFHYNKVVFKANGTLVGDCRIDTLIINAGNYLYAWSSYDIRIVDSLIINGSDCGHYTRFYGGELSELNILKPHQFNYIILDGLKNTGANATLNHCVVNDSAIGWSFANDPSPKTLYWVGGSGDWSDGDHWSDTSGGAPTGCVPTLLDNVHFDEHSFDTAAIDIDKYVFCRDFICDSIPYGADVNLNKNSRLYIYGSLYLKPDFVFRNTNSSYIYFMSDSTDELIDFSGTPIISSGFKSMKIYFDGKGSWELLDSISMMTNTAYNNKTSIQVLNGVLNTNGHAIKTGRIGVHGVGAIDISGSELFLNNSGKSWEVTGTLISADSSVIYMTNADTIRIQFLGGSNSYPEVHAYEDCYFKGNNANDTIGKLYLERGCDYEIDSGATIKIENDIILFDSSSKNTSIWSRDTIVTATITKASGNICLNKVDVEGIKVMGGATFTMGYGSNDLGGNTGWGSSNSYCHAYLGGKVFTHDSLPYSNEEVVLFDMKGSALADTVAMTKTASDGSYFFDNQVLGDYLIMVKPNDLSIYAPIYYPSDAIWMDADSLSLISDTLGLDITMIDFSAPLTGFTGTGKISGFINEGIGMLRGPGDPLQGVIISLYNLNLNDVVGVSESDSQGSFKFENVSSGDYSVIPDVTGVPVDTSGLNQLSVGNSGDTISIDFIVDSNLIYPDSNTVVSIKKEEGQLKVMVYPNPADRNKGIVVKGIEGGYAKLFDLKGELLFEGKLKEGEPLFIGDVLLLPGIYFLNLKVDNNSYTFKLMIK